MSYGLRVWRSDGFLVVDLGSKFFSVSATGIVSVPYGNATNFNVGVPNMSSVGSRAVFTYIWQENPYGIPAYGSPFPVVSWSRTSTGFAVSAQHSRSGAVGILRYWVIVR